MGNALFVAFAAVDVVLGRLGFGHSLLQRNIPSITLGIVVGLEGVLVSVELEGEFVGGALFEVGDVGLIQYVSSLISKVQLVYLRD